ncbi:ParA family protein [Halorhabdus sp. SVX81]|uniref:ParA family protein n=1 Tax=Halorhabdus sp. SVX81 TaxID=2978283 RepID=UPI0023DA4D1C|nr:ParA family protein [Halorhabdus sp. SVX81]
MSSDTSARPATVCVTNAKGGTGKTTIAINVAGALNERGHDVLFVDMDPQGNATEGLGLLDSYDAEPPTLFDVLTDREMRSSIDDLIVEHEEMDVVPSSVDLLQAEHELTIADLMAWANTDPTVDIDPAALSSLAINVTPETVPGDHALELLDLALSTVKPEYDVIIIDSPPFYGKLTDTAIYAARSVLVPALTEASSERAIELLVDQIAALESQVDIDVDTVGVVANRVEQTNEDTAMLEWLETVFEDYPIWEVRKRVALQRAFSAGTSIFAYEQSVDMESVFLDIAEGIETQYEIEAAEVPA